MLQQEKQDKNEQNAKLESRKHKRRRVGKTQETDGERIQTNRTKI